MYLQFGGFTKFYIKMACCLKFRWYLRTLSLKFRKARTKTKIEVFLSLPCWVSQPTGQLNINICHEFKITMTILWDPTQGYCLFDYKYLLMC